MLTVNMSTFYFCGLVIWVCGCFIALGLAKFQLWGFFILSRQSMAFLFLWGVYWHFLFLGLGLLVPTTLLFTGTAWYSQYGLHGTVNMVVIILAFLMLELGVGSYMDLVFRLDR